MLGKYVSEMINQEHVQTLPPSWKDWVEKAFSFIPTDTEMVEWSFDTCGITKTNKSKVRSGSFYKSWREVTCKHIVRKGVWSPLWMPSTPSPANIFGIVPSFFSMSHWLHVNGLLTVFKNCYCELQYPACQMITFSSENLETITLKCIS